MWKEGGGGGEGGGWGGGALFPLYVYGGRKCNSLLHLEL